MSRRLSKEDFDATFAAFLKTVRIVTNVVKHLTLVNFSEHDQSLTDQKPIVYYTANRNFERW